MDILVQQRQLMWQLIVRPRVNPLLSIQPFGHQLVGFSGSNWGIWWWQPHFNHTKHVDFVRVGWAMIGGSAWLRVTSRDFGWLRVTSFCECMQNLATFLWMYSKNEYIHGISSDFAWLPRDFAWLRVTLRDFAWLRVTSHNFVTCFHGRASPFCFVLLCGPFSSRIENKCEVLSVHSADWKI